MTKFFFSPENARCLSGLRDKVTVRNTDGSKVVLQKYLCLGTYRELYNDFKTNNPTANLSLSKFVLLKPPNIIPLPKSKHQNVCVCVKHENFKLLLDGIGISDYKSLISRSVCNFNSKNCMYGRCGDCKNKINNLEAYN